MKFIVDESTGKGVADFLRDKDHDTAFVGAEMKSASDSEIMDRALKEDRVIVKNDKDFGELAVKKGKDAEGILLLRLQIETPRNKKKALENLLKNHKDKIRGNLLIAREDQIKTRKL
ncbi:MAG: DUF5615 family PIN-like protein [Candidatus Nanohaloarchaea archaeon]